jgi:hypothetical protein
MVLADGALMQRYDYWVLMAVSLLALGTMLRLITSVVQFSDMLETKNAYCHE